jgi:tetratricopeptide (TPR) repeat protein
MSPRTRRTSGRRAAVHGRRGGRVTQVVAAVALLVALAAGAGAVTYALREDKPSVETMLAAGLAAQRQGDPDTARSIYRQVLERDDDNAIAHFNLGVIAQAAGDPGTALREYDAAIAADPEFADAYYNKAILLTETDKPAAVEAYRKVTALQPQSAAAHLNLGLLLADLGRDAEAKIELRAAIAQDPSLRARVPKQHADLLARLPVR